MNYKITSKDVDRLDLIFTVLSISSLILQAGLIVLVARYYKHVIPQSYTCGIGGSIGFTATYLLSRAYNKVLQRLQVYV